MWSYTGSRTFLKCQRQWFYRIKYKHHLAGDTRRREAYLLSKLQTLDAWRGTLVDQVISQHIIPQLKSRQPISLDVALRYAKTQYQEQLEFGLKHRIREDGMKPSKSPVAFHAIEYGNELSDADCYRAWLDIEKSLINFFEAKELLNELKRANYLVPQRALTFKLFQGISVKAVPDLIAFSRNEPPLLLDWKVNTLGTRNYRLQLAIYAIALERHQHDDFPDYLARFVAHEYRLLEVQLLTNQLRWYTLTTAEIENAEAYIASTSVRMELALDGDGQLRPADFPVTNHPEVCQTCPFLSLCREESE